MRELCYSWPLRSVWW